MTRIVIKKLVWDDWNREHIEKHSVTVDEVEITLKNLVAHKKGYKGRYIIIGRCKNRLISVVVDRKDKNTYYVVTTRDSDKKERRIAYEKENK